MDAAGTYAMALDTFTLVREHDYRCALSAYDFDGDETPEVFVHCTTFGDSDAQRPRVRLLATARGSEVLAFPSARTLDVEAMRDLDGDGVPELLYLYFRAEHMPCDPMSPLYVAAWAKIGGFATSSPGWDRLLRVACPSPASADLPAGGDPAWRMLACARLWGRNEKEVRATIRRACDAPLSETRANNASPEPCTTSKDGFRLWLTPPPRVLR